MMSETSVERRNPTFVDELWDSDIIACLDALKEADEAVTTINKDMFNILARSVQEIRNDGGDLTQIKRVLKNFEKKYKRERGVQHMPGSYRSAKSVIINAVKAELDLYDGPELKGKTALERETRQVQRKQDSSKLKGATVDQFVRDARFQLGFIIPRVIPIENEREVHNNLISIEERIQEIRKTYGV